MNGWMTRITKHWETTDAFGRFWEEEEEGGEAPVKWVSSRRTMVAYLWESQGRRGGERKGGRNREVELAGPLCQLWT